MSPCRPSLPRRQRGAILAVSLIILLIMTVLGVSTMRSTSLEERMAANKRDRSLSFQAAEIGLRDAEQYSEETVTTEPFNGSSGLYGLDDAEPDYAAAATWSGTDPDSVAAGAVYGTSAAPRYVIKQIGLIEAQDGSLAVGGGYGTLDSTGDVTVFKITARGQGASDATQSLVRSHYGKDY